MQTILVIREFDRFSRVLSENNFSLINCPTIKIVELENLGDFERKMSALEYYDGIFLTSFNAAKIFRRQLESNKRIFSGKVYVLGRRSFEILKNSALNVFFDETTNSANEMLNKIVPEELRNKKLLFVRGNNSLNVIANFLKDKATLDETIVYKTEKREIEAGEISELRAKIENKEICCACFFSPSAAESFIEQFDTKVLHQTRIATIGKTTAEFFERENLNVDFVSSKSNAESFAFELIAYLKGN